MLKFICCKEEAPLLTLRLSALRLLFLHILCLIYEIFRAELRVLPFYFTYGAAIFNLEVLTITDLMINGQIRDKEVRLISNTGEQLGIMSARDAQKVADERNLDLVKISPQAKPPVCKIMDYSKYKFDLAKKEKEARKKQKTIETKELRLSPNIDTHDVQVKVKNAMKFLKAGNKVKVSIRFRGRELSRQDVAIKIMKDFAEQVSEFGIIEKEPKMEARTMAMFLGPKTN